MISFWLCLLSYEDLHRPGRSGSPDTLARIRMASPSIVGDTTALLSVGSVGIQARADQTNGWRDIPLAIEALRTDAPSALCEQILGRTSDCLPLVLIRHGHGRARFFHWMSAGKAGSIFTAFAERACEPSAAALVDALAACSQALDDARPGLSAGHWHTRWRQDMELERKFTFKAPIDAWALSRDLHKELRAGAWPRVIPEFNEEFHVWDYESAMFVVIAPPESVGYVGIIPQADGLTTLKYKRFQDDCELRHEDLHPNRRLEEREWADAARELSGGTVRRLPGFRRKRFDCDLEVVDTGNAYGIFIDTCQLTDDPSCSLVQCEVEYLRTRRFDVHGDIETEFATVCDMTRDFLRRHDCLFDEGYYSKLSFVREHAKAKAA